MATSPTSGETQSSQNVDQNQKSLQILWEDFKAAFKQIFETEPNEMKREKAMDMQKILHDIVSVCQKLSKRWEHADQLYSEIREYLEEFLSKKMLIGQELNGEELLGFYTNLWESYHFSSKALKAGSDNLNWFFIQERIYKEIEISEGFLEIYSLTLITWKENVFDKVYKKVTYAVLDLMENERRGVNVDSSLVCRCIDSYFKLGLVDKEEASDTLVDSIAKRSKRDEPHLTIYQKYFEKDYLMTTESFYMKEAVEYLKENADCIKCTQKMEKCLEEELKRFEIYLHQSTGEKLKNSFKIVFRMISDSSFGWNNFLDK